MVLFAMLGATMFASRFATEILPPNMHLIGLFIASVTLVFRAKALIPIYIWIALEGVFRGISPWWAGYLYVWLPLWGVFMLLGALKIPNAARMPVYMAAAGLHGLSFGTLFAPVNAVFFGFSTWAAVRAWIVAGLPFDIMHAVGNIAAGVLIVPLAALLSTLYNGQRR